MQQALILGAGRVFLIELIQYRLEIAARLGAIPIQTGKDEDGCQALLDYTQGRRADLIVDTCGVASVQANSLAMVRKGGRIVFMGLPREAASLLPRTLIGWCVVRWSCMGRGILIMHLTQEQPGMLTWDISKRVN